MIRRTLMLAAALAVFASPAGAQEEYDGTSGSATVSGDVIVVQSEGFEPNAEIDYTVDFTPEGDENAAASLEAAGVLFAKAPAVPSEVVETGTTTSDADGNVEFQIENRGPGFYEITITDGTNTDVVGITVAGDGNSESAAGASAETGDLPLTGAAGSIGVAQIAVVLLVLGAVAVYVAKRRRGADFAD